MRMYYQYLVLGWCVCHGVGFIYSLFACYLDYVLVMPLDDRTKKFLAWDPYQDDTA